MKIGGAYSLGPSSAAHFSYICTMISTLFHFFIQFGHSYYHAAAVQPHGAPKQKIAVADTGSI